MVLKIDYLKVAWQIFHSFVSVSKKDLPNISLKLAGAQEVCSSRLSRTENKLPLISACAWIIHKKLLHSSDRFFDSKRAPNSDSNRVYEQTTAR